MRFGRRVFADPDISIGSDAIHLSLKKVKVFIHLKRWVLLNHKTRCKRIDLKYYEVGKNMAMEVRRLEKIAKDLQVCYMMAKIKESIQRQVAH